MKHFIRICKSLALVLVVCMISSAQSYAQSSEQAKGQAEALFQKGLDYYDAGDYDKAVETYTQVITLDATHVNAYWARGHIYSEQEKHALAVADFRKVIELAPNFGDAYGMLGWHLIVQGKFEEAREPCRKAHELVPEYFGWAANLGHTYLLTRDAATARRFYERTLPLLKSEDDFLTGPVADFELFIENGWQVETCRQELAWMKREFETIYRAYIEANSYWTQATEHKEQGRYLEAAQLFEKAVEAEQSGLKPRLVNLATALHQAGYCYQVITHYDKALDYYQQALELERKLGREASIALDLNNIGQVYDAWGRYDKALEYYEQALELSRKLGMETEIARALNNIGAVYEAWGQYENALDYYEQALELERKLGRKANIAICLNNIGLVYRVWGQYNKALDVFEQALEIARNLSDDLRMAIYLNNIAGVFETWGQYDKALDYYQQALDIDRKLDREASIAVRLGNIGRMYSVWGQYDKALEYYQQALELDRKLGREANIATRLSNIGGVYKVWGHYDKALESYQQALELNSKLGREAEISTVLNNIGTVYADWGHSAKALEYYQHALESDRKLGREAEIATDLNNIGSVYDRWEQYDNALVYYQQALELNRKLGQEAGITTTLNNIGTVYKAWGYYEKALDYSQQALEFNRKLGREAEVATVLNSIGLVYHEWRHYDKALDYYRQALEFDRKLGRKPEIARGLHNIGGVYYNQQKYPEAIPYFVESVELKEQLRKTATGDVRREYLASQIYTYEFLISCYIRTGDFVKAFQIIELSRAKRLTEQLAGTDEVSIPSPDHIQSELPEDTGVLIYANTDWQSIVQVVITKEKITASEHSLSESGQNVMNQEHSDATRILSETRGLNMGQKKPQQAVTTDVKKPFDLTTFIKDYRAQLLNPSPSRGLSLEAQKKPARDNKLKDTPKRDLSTRLYSLLFGNVQQQLQEKTRLIIVPDGTLNFLPFETLIDDQGKYLVETYQISYAQSLGVLDLIGQRRYTPDRKPLLAFGGAIYDAPTYEAQMIENETQLAYLQKQIDDALSKGEPVGKLYAQLRGSGWSNLPGTLQEVKAIQQVMQGAEIVTGADVNEAVVKNLSAKGELADYKVLHFATHGDADARIPELSALVLSLLPGSADISSALDAGETPALPGEEDGYLRAGEIMSLDINTDFVNLSACETGLGKLYSGEGMVGLTQAFLLAGANGLSVSLWSVADESTAAFMVALYKLVEEQDLSYAEALTEVKRRFIAGDFGEKWKAPYYWAPFVYYGR